MDPYICAFKTTFCLPDSQAEWKRKHTKTNPYTSGITHKKSLHWKLYCHIIILFTISCASFSPRKMQIWKQSRKRMPENPGKALTTAGLLRNGRGGREMCLQLGLPRAGPITSMRSQAEEISRVNLSCGPKWIKGNLGWSHYKEINRASYLPLSCYPA